MKISGIYKITSPTGKVYIGQSVNIDRRWLDYRKMRCKKQGRIYNSFVKHGVDNHKFEVIYKCTKTELNEKERHFQDMYCVIGKRGLNGVLVKTGNKLMEVSAETRKLMSKIRIGRKESIETKNKKSIEGKRLFAEGKLKIAIKGERMSDEKKIKIRNGNIGKFVTAESRKKMSDAQKGRVVSIETKKRLSESHKGIRVSEETKIKLSISLKGRKKTDEHIRNAAEGRRIANAKAKGTLIIDQNKHEQTNLFNQAP